MLELTKITILDVMAMLEQSWSALLDKTVINCFKNVGISKESQQDSIQDTNDLFAQLSEMLDKLRALDPDLAPGSLTADTFINTDEEVATSIRSLPSVKELLHEFTIENTSNQDAEMIGDESDETESTEKEQRSKKALFEAMDLIESFTLSQNDDIAMQMRKCTAQLNKLIALPSCLKQSTITSFFNSTVTN